MFENSSSLIDGASNFASNSYRQYFNEDSFTKNANSKMTKSLIRNNRIKKDKRSNKDKLSKTLMDAYSVKDECFEPHFYIKPENLTITQRKMLISRI